MPSLLTVLYNEFATVLNLVQLELEQDAKFIQCCEELAGYLSRYQLLPLRERERAFLAHVNWKFRINADHLAVFYARGAKLGQTFNYHQKRAIQLAFDRAEIETLPQLLRSFGVEVSVIEVLAHCAVCATVADTQAVLHAELDTPSKLRREVGERDVHLEILKALFASFLWVSLPARDMHRFFDTDFDEKRYCESFWEELQQRSPRLFHRNEAVHFLVITDAWCAQFRSLDLLRDAVLGRVRDSYEQLNNYGFLVVLLQSAPLDERDISWELAADIILFGEKHLERPLDHTYFRPDRISAATVEHIPNLSINEARFDLANEGFTYRDCFILTHRQTKQLEQLLILQKHHRDETIVPCPTCRSNTVEGNSYPSLGVRSWECRNPLCPDRSKYNRGKRYSFRGLAMQQAIDDERNDISSEFVRRWRRDVVEVASYDEVLEMVVRHYSIWGDEIRCFGELAGQPAALLGRALHWESVCDQGASGAAAWFDSAAFFKRYRVKPPEVPPVHWPHLGDDRLKVFCGDSRHVLRTFERASIDGAVTSPPYYNARDYSQWPNMYCYLQDMFEVNAQVFRVLKSGGLYFYNIFDYFDNENIAALSAMGQKRVTLSAYTVDLFRRIGFECVGNVVWDKGEIEGKRGFNAGNFSPFYQSPFNCWEHVLVFRKPGDKSPDFGGSRVLRAKPVLKMVRGKNTHGHTAPFPEDIPLLCIEALPRNSVILDPFGGSLTTGRAAVAAGRRAICIEQSQEYCELGLSLYEAPSDSYLQEELAL
jgi:DNA modification methylase